MSDVKDVELTEVYEVKRGETLLEATEAKREMETVLNRLMGDSNSLKKLEDEFSMECREARTALRALQKAQRPETRRLIEKEKRRSACEKQTASTPFDWAMFALMGLILHGITASLFSFGLLTFIGSRDDDATLWVWFVLEGFFATLLIYGIVQANKARKAREAADLEAVQDMWRYKIQQKEIYINNNADHIKKKRKLCHVFYKTKEERGGIKKDFRILR